MDFGKVRCSVSPQEFQVRLEALRQGVLSSPMEGALVPRTDSLFLATFLRTKSYEVDAALKAVQKYYACVYKNLSFIEGITVRSFESGFNSNVFSLFKHKFNGIRVALVRVKNWKPKEVELKALQMSAMFIFEEYIRNNPDIQENGVAVIFDLEGVRLEHVRQFSVRELRRVVNAIQDGIPIRVAGAHFLNPTKLGWPIFQLALKCLKEKIRKRVQIHYGLESLHKSLDKSLLPESLGGDLNEDEASERHVIDMLIQENPSFEKYWNGAIEKVRFERRVSRKRSHDVMG